MGWRRVGRRPRSARGVSEVVATVILLAMTITMFASVFLFTSAHQGTAAQATNQFSSSLSYTSSSKSQVASITIVHLTGATLSGASTGQVAIYVVSQNHPGTIPTPSTIADGRNGATTWSFGQNWTLSLATYDILSPDNLTVSVVAQGQLEYRTTLFAVAPLDAPYLSEISTSPTQVSSGNSTFVLSCYATFSTTSLNTVTVNESQIGGSSQAPMSGSGGSGVYTLTIQTPASDGTYYLFLTATASNGPSTVTVFSLVVT